jgi:ABC-type multidrug transport system ATPase subunit
VLCGLVYPDGGDAFVFGKNVKTQISKIRKHMGVCPQQ